MLVHVLLYDAGTESEGIHSIEIKGITVVLMFENIDDAERYCGLLEAQDFPKPDIETIDQEQIEHFCLTSGYKAKFVESGFVPKTNEDRMMLSPPEINRDVSNWKNANNESVNIDENNLFTSNDQLDQVRKSLEELI